MYLALSYDCVLTERNAAVPENRIKHVGCLNFPMLCDQLTKLCGTQCSSLEECMKLMAVCCSSTGHFMYNARFEGFTANEYTKNTKL